MISYRDLCIKTYRSTVANTPMSSDLRDALKTHERVPIFIDNISNEMNKVQMDRLASKKKIHSDERIAWVIEEMTQMFIESIKAEANERNQSSLNKQINKDKVNKQKELDDFTKGIVPSDMQGDVKIVGRNG